MRDVYAVRSHVPDQQTLASYRMLTASYDSRRVFIVADEVSSPPVAWPSSVNVVRVTRGLVERLGLRSDLKDSGWRCGDYAHAALTEAISAERVWMIEPDVAFSRLLPRAFFGLFDSDPAALIAHGIGPADGWAWNGTLTHRGFVGPEWRCFFPVTRLTPAAVHAALELRREVQWVDTDVMQPNDEIVVSSAVARHRLPFTQLRDAAPELFAHFEYGARRPLWWLKARHRGPQVLHPVGSRRPERVVDYYDNR